MTPGPVSDSYDPEFGTAANAHHICTAIATIVERKITSVLGEELVSISDLVYWEKPGKTYTLRVTEKELRILRFAANRAVESI